MPKVLGSYGPYSHSLYNRTSAGRLLEDLVDGIQVQKGTTVSRSKSEQVRQCMDLQHCLHCLH
jgi:hypothetical protein